MKKYSILLIISILAIILIAGCGGGGGSTGVIPNNGSVTTIDPTATPGTLVEVPGNPAATPGSTIPSNLPTGSFKVDVKFPGSGSGLRAKDLAGSDLPYNSHTLRVTITGEAIATSIVGERNDLDPSGAGTYTLTVSNVPVGLNTATIEVLAPSGNLLCQRKHGFYMTPGATEGPGLIQLGIAIGPDGSCNPQEIDIPAGTDLLFQNQDYDNDRQIWLNGLTLGIGPIAHAEHITQPVTAEVFHTESHLFDMAGTYNYDPGYGGPGRILVYGLPVLTGIANNSDPSNDYSAVNFTLTGDNFGLSRDSVNGDIRFIQVNEDDPNNPWGSSFGGAFINEWTDDYITGTIEISPGKYRIEVTVRGENTTEQVIFYKGTGNYEITVGDPNSTPPPSPTPGYSGNISRVSVASDGTEGNYGGGTSPSSASFITSNNRYIVFGSNSSNLVSGDNNNYADIFVHDRQTGQNIVASLDSSGNQGNNSSLNPVISADGRYVAFMTRSSNLMSGSSSNWNICLRDLQENTTVCVSSDISGNPANDSIEPPVISADGRYVVFPSHASNLISGDTNNTWDIFVYDNQTQSKTRVSVDSSGNQANGYSFKPSVSSDGRYVAFYSYATNLVSGDTNGKSDVFVHDRQTGITERVSVDSSGTQGNNESFSPYISSNGRYVVFASSASNLVSGDTNCGIDVFLHDRQTGLTERVSISYSGGQIDSGIYSSCSSTSVSSDGRYIVFDFTDSNLVADDTNSQSDIFVRDRQAGETRRISVDSSGNQADNMSYFACISPDGQYVVFTSSASNLVPDDTNLTDDVFIRSILP